MMPQRPPMSGPPLPPSRPPVSPFVSSLVAAGLVLGAVLAIPAAILVAIALWSPMWSLSSALTRAIDRGADLVGTAILLLIGAAGAALIWRLFAGAEMAHNRARGAKVVKLQSGQPVLLDDLRDITRASLRDTMSAFYAVEMQKAMREHPELRNYVNSPRIATTAPPMVEPAALPPANVPSFAALLAAGKVGKGQPLLLGVDSESGQELAGSWLDLYSTAVAGLPGTGKTTSQRFFACQTALHAAKFVVIDPHMGASDDSLAATLAPLHSAFLVEPASHQRQILEAVKLVRDIGERRITGKDDDKTPIILWCDEITSLLGRSSIGGELAELMEQIAQEYRKRFIYLSASGQIWTASRTTSELRDSFASVLCHRMKRGQARLLLPTEEAQQVERLSTGRAVLWRTSGQTQVVCIPDTTSADCERVGSMLGDQVEPVSTAEPAARSMGFRTGSDRGSDLRPAEPPLEPPLEPRGTAHQRAINPRTLRVLQLLAEKRGVNEIIKEVWGVSGKGYAYQKAAEELREIMAEIAQLAGR